MIKHTVLLFFVLMIAGCGSIEKTVFQNTATTHSSPEDFPLDAGRPYCTPRGAFLPRKSGCYPTICDRVFFAPGQYTLDSFALTSLQAQANVIKESRFVRVRLEGFSASKGSLKRNLHLARMRVEAVKNYFLSVGVHPEQIGSIGYQTLAASQAESSAYQRRVVTVQY